MAMLRGEYEQGERRVVIFLAFVEQPRGITIREVVLREGIAIVGKFLQNRSGFSDQLKRRSRCPLDVRALEIARRFGALGPLRIAEGEALLLCRGNQEDGERILDRVVVGLLDILPVHL